MQSIIHCSNCGFETLHDKKGVGSWFYKVCDNCGKETLLEGMVWEEFDRRRIDNNKGKSGLVEDAPAYWGK